VTKKGAATRMGGGKGNISHYVFPVKAGRIIFEIGGTCEYQEVEKLLRILRPKMPFKARIVLLDESFLSEHASNVLHSKPTNTRNNGN
jgi:large subunit ribosomal protein L16